MKTKIIFLLFTKYEKEKKMQLNLCTCLVKHLRQQAHTLSLPLSHTVVLISIQYFIFNIGFIYSCFFSNFRLSAYGCKFNRKQTIIRMSMFENENIN